jgi:hypothetical protein
MVVEVGDEIENREYCLQHVGHICMFLRSGMQQEFWAQRWQQMSCSTCALICIPLRTVVGDWISEQVLCITLKLEQLLTSGDQPDECVRESPT